MTQVLKGVARTGSLIIVLDPNTQLDSLTSQPAPLINGENLLASLNKNNQPLIDISTVEVT